MTGFRIAHEGAASFVAPVVADAKGLVFYNPLMRLNRDLAVAVACTVEDSQGRFIIADPMTGCGIRAIRYALEVKRRNPQVYASDANRYAVTLARRNVRRNRVAGKVSVERADANAALTSHGRVKDRFHLVDLDPFGSPSTFFDSAARAIRDGGIIAVTATDTAVLCGARPAACIRKYGARPLRTEYCHELGVRILLGALAVTAARQDVGVEALLAYREAHYLRVYARARRRTGSVDSAVGQIGFLFHCFHCLDRGFARNPREMPRHCPTCGKPVSQAGPLWTGTLYDQSFLERLRNKILAEPFTQANSGLYRLINGILHESTAPAPYVVLDAVCDKYGLPMPKPKSVIQALREAGYSAVPAHFRSNAIRTDAKLPRIVQLIRELTGRN